MQSRVDLFRTCLRHYADRNLEAISAMYADDIHLRDWNISVYGKAAAVRETAKNFAEADSLQITILEVYEQADAVAGEVHIVVNGSIELFVVDIMTFDANNQIRAIRSYKGRGD